MTIHRYEQIDSTNETALAAVAACTASDGDVHVASAQSSGRGRQGRAWLSPPGTGLYLSYVHLPPTPPPRPEAVTMAAGLAVGGAVHTLGATSARLKWPNDVVVPGSEGLAKLAGILVESRGFQPEAPHFVVGVGLNVGQESFPPELEAERPVTSLRRLGLDVSLVASEAALLARLPERLAQARLDPVSLFADYLEAAALAGARVEVTTGDELWSGTIRGIGTDFTIEIVHPEHGNRRIPLAHVQALRPES